MATKSKTEHKALSVSEKMEIIKKVDAEPQVTHTKVVKELNIPLATLNNIMANKKNIHQNFLTSQTGRRVKNF
jgi:plasmid maintenance system antidote protein VapI